MNKSIQKCKRYIKGVLVVLFPMLWVKFRYYRAYHSRCDLKNPKTFSEKLLWLNRYVYRNNELIQTVGDKYLARGYLESLGHGEILNELYAVWDDETKIDWEKLPNRFVLKLSVGCGTNLLCPDKSKLDIGAAKEQLSEWMHPGYFALRARFVGGSKPHKEVILCERYLGLAEKSLCDYKFYCFNGTPKAILVINDRFSSEKNAVFMSLDWRLISDVSTHQNSRYKKASSLPDRPECLTQMIDIAQSLSAPFPFMRIDLYEVEGKVYFGEFTMSPAGCIGASETMVDGKTMGELLELPQRNRRK